MSWGTFKVIEGTIIMTHVSVKVNSSVGSSAILIRCRVLSNPEVNFMEKALHSVTI